MNKLSELSVFFPAYNEEKNIEKTVDEAIDTCQKVASEFEIIVVDDGSSDSTPLILEKLQKKYPFVRTITHNPNRGYGGALKSGMYAAKYEYVAFTDSDGQFNFSQIDRFIPYITDYQLVIGYRINRAEGIVRWCNAKLWGTLVTLLFGLQCRDVDCAFKLFKKEVIDTIPGLESEGALISTEFLVKSKNAGFKCKEVPVDHFERKAGKPTGANITVIARAFTELFKLWGKLSTQSNKI